MFHYFYHLDYLPDAELPQPTMEAAATATDQKTEDLVSDKESMPASLTTEAPTPTTVSSSVTSQPRVYIIEHTKVFAIAVKYQVEGLRNLAIAKFKQSAKTHWDHEDFVHAIAIVHDPKLDDVPQLRVIVADILYEHFGAMKHRAEIETLICKTPSLSYAMFKRLKLLRPVKTDSHSTMATTNHVFSFEPGSACIDGHSGEMSITVCQACHTKFDICEACQSWRWYPSCGKDM